MSDKRFLGLDDALQRKGVGDVAMDPEQFDRLGPTQQEAWLYIAQNKLSPGDQHPIRKGWYLTNRVGNDGVPLWYKPPSRVSVWTRRIALGLWIGMMALGLIGATLEHFLS